MDECPYAEGWKNKEGFFRVAHAPEGNPWAGEIVCMDWDAFCTKCLKEKQRNELD